jgi:endonuclease G
MARLERDDAHGGLAALRLTASPVRAAIESLARGNEIHVGVALEAIVRKEGRPVLYIQDDAVTVPDAVLPLWKRRIRDAKAALEAPIRRVGRIELRGHPRYPWFGTGWLIAPGVVVTNRHVAEVFAYPSDGMFRFRSTPVSKPMGARIDLYQEYQGTRESEFEVQDVLHIEPEGGPDVALLHVASRDTVDRELPPPIPLADRDPVNEQLVAAIGYAAWDGQRNAQGVMEQIFEGVYDVKRLHPGEIMAVQETHLKHDCSTLGGNSGSAVIDLETGCAVGLHYAGYYERQNYAVKATTLRAILERRGIDIHRGV